MNIDISALTRERKPIIFDAKGYRCPQCERFNVHQGYVHANWGAAILHTCVCGHRVVIERGEVSYPSAVGEALTVHGEVG
jgi:transcription elongation factor Elf1